MFGVGLVLIVGGAIAELFRRRLREWAMGLYLVALIVVIHATVPLLSPHVPEYAWVFKHIGVIQTLGANIVATSPTQTTSTRSGPRSSRP